MFGKKKEVTVINPRKDSVWILGSVYKDRERYYQHTFIRIMTEDKLHGVYKMEKGQPILIPNMIEVMQIKHEYEDIALEMAELIVKEHNKALNFPIPQIE